MRKLRWGVIGAGGIAERRTIPGLLLAQNAELIAVMEVDRAQAERIREKFNARKAYDSVDTLLADPLVDTVYIASPVAYHYGQVAQAARAGKHILVEKPAALTSEQGEAARIVCAENGVLAAVGLMMRFHAYHRKLRELIRQGKLGQIVSCRAQLTCWYPEIPGAWRQEMALSGGGALMDMGIHCADLLQYVTGGKAVRAAAMTGSKVFQYEVEDSASLIFETDSGAYCTVDANFNIPDAAARCRLEIYGTKGSALAEGTIAQEEGGTLDLLITGDSLGYDSAQNQRDVHPVPLEVAFGNLYTKEIESFGESVLEGKALEAPLAEGIQVQRVIEAAYESSRTGRFVTL